MCIKNILFNSSNGTKENDQKINDEMFFFSSILIEFQITSHQHSNVNKR